MDKLEIKVKRILQGEESTKAMGSCAFVSGDVPEDGYMFSTSTPLNGPIFIRDSDLQRAREAREEKGKIVAIEAQSWDEDEEVEEGDG